MPVDQGKGIWRSCRVGVERRSKKGPRGWAQVWEEEDSDDAQGG